MTELPARRQRLRGARPPEHRLPRKRWLFLLPGEESPIPARNSRLRTGPAPMTEALQLTLPLTGAA